MARESTPLVSSADKIVEAFEALMTELQVNMVSLPQKTTTLTKSNRSVSAVLAILSGFMYWFSTEKAGDRYAQYLGIIAVKYIVEFCCAATNGLFNAESFMVLMAAHKTKRSDAEKILTKIHGEKLKWFFSAVSGFCMVFPTLYAGGTTVINDASGALNVPVNSQGAHEFFTWVGGFDFKSRFFDWMSARYSSDGWERQQENLAFRAARNLIAARLRDQATIFSHFNVEAREQILQKLMRKEWGELFSTLLKANLIDLLNDDQRSTVSPPKLDVQFGFGLWTLFGVLVVLGLYQNEGYILETDEGGNAISHSWVGGVGLSVWHAFSALGFSIGGLIALYAAMKRLISGITSIEETEMAGWSLTVCSWSMGAIASLSGFTADYLGYNTSKKYFPSLGEVGAVISGALHNIGAAIVYNLPQCLYFRQRVLQDYLLERNSDNNDHKKNVKGHILFVNGLRHLANILERMPMEVCKIFFGDGRMPQKAMFDYLFSKMDKEVLSKLGEFYSNQSPLGLPDTAVEEMTC